MQLNSLKVYRLLKPNVSLVMDDEKYFTLTDNTARNRSFYTSDPSTTPPKVNFKHRMKFEPKLFVWWAVSAKRRSSVYIYRSKDCSGGGGQKRISTNALESGWSLSSKSTTKAILSSSGQTYPTLTASIKFGRF